MTKWIERNTSRKGALVFLLAVNFFCFLYCVHWVCELHRLKLVIGVLMLLLWIVLVIAEEIRILIYDRQQICISPNGVSVGKGKHTLQIRWEEIREVEIREAVGIGASRWGNPYLVFSKQILSEPRKDMICSDLDPWIPVENIIEFRYAPIENDDGIIALLKQKCPLFDKIVEQYAGYSFAYANEDRVAFENAQQLAKRTHRAKTFTSLMISRDFLWFWTVLISLWEFSSTQGTIFGIRLLIIFWIASFLSAIGCILYRRKLLQRYLEIHYD